MGEGGGGGGEKRERERGGGRERDGGRERGTNSKIHNVISICERKPVFFCTVSKQVHVTELNNVCL